MWNRIQSVPSGESTFCGIILAILFTCLISASVFAQDITNTLAPGGKFIVKDVSNNYLTVDQSTGQVNILKTLRLENTTSSTTGIIFKGMNRFIHSYYNDGTSYNTFMGINAGNFTLTTANFNTGIGHSSLFSLTTGYFNTAIGYQSLYSNTTGNYNAAVGYMSLSANTIGNYNTALGMGSLYANSTGVNNTAVGSNSLGSNTSGSSNTATGYKALYSNTTGNYITALGEGALYLNTTGYVNTALGYESLYSNTTGYYNTAVGNRVLYSNTTGFGNTAVGTVSLYSNTGYANTALGYESLQYNTTGAQNTAVGYTAGYNITTGSNLTCLGYDAQPTSASATNQITLGNASITSLRCNVTTITSLSDARDKKNIKDLNLGIDFLMKIKPRQFNWDKREWYDDNKSDGSKMKEEPTAGFIAQELDEAQATENAEWLNLVLKNNPEKWEATPGNLLPVIVKAVQDLNLKCNELKAENEQLRTQLAEVGEIKEQIEEVKFLKTELKEQIKILKASNNGENLEFSFINNERISK
jgi:trimeric autotransporter adhesin